MPPNSVFSGNCKCLTITSFFFLMLGLLGGLISAGCYYGKIKPWGKYDSNRVMLGYYGSIFAIIFGILGLLMLLLMIIISFCPSCPGNECFECILGFLAIILTIASFITDVLSALPELSVPNEKHFPMCYDYLFNGIIGNMLDYAAELFDKRKEALYIEISGFIELYGDGMMNSNLCGKAGIPTMIFVIIQIIGILFFILSTCCSCCCSCCGKPENDANEQAIQSSSLL